jgi:hypothetical protein
MEIGLLVRALARIRQVDGNISNARAFVNDMKFGFPVEFFVDVDKVDFLKQKMPKEFTIREIN